MAGAVTEIPLLVRWDDQFLLGDDVIDEQHRQIFEMFNRVYRSLLVKPGGLMPLALAEEMRDLMVAHFKAEEAYMIRIGYPEFKEHKKCHKGLLKRSESLLEGLSKGFVSLDISVVHILRDWVFGHVLLEDKELIKWAQRKEPVDFLQQSSV